jgi:alpha-L-arabinofuranosidase
MQKALTSLITCCLALVPLAAQQPEARIKIDIERQVGEVHPYVFGNFAEHLGRCIYGGIYEEGSPLADADGYRKDVMQGTKDLGVTLLRWPGGNFASGYNWKDGIGPKDKRPTQIDHAWDGIETNRFGTDEFLKYCERVGVAPYICINTGLGSIEDARNWVEYTNEARHSYWADQRRKNGRDEPYKVKIWGLGNEIDGPWQLGHKNAEDYTKFALEAAKAMRRVDPSITLIASGSSNFRPDADWIGWNRTVLEKLRTEIDYISLHTYVGNRDNNLEKFLANGDEIDHRIDVVRGLIAAARSDRPNQRPIYIAYDEWNVWYRVRGGDRGNTLEEIYNFEDALAMGMFLNSFIRNADVVKIANLAQLVNVIAPMFTNKQGMFLQPIFFPIAEYAKQKGNTSLSLFVTQPAKMLDVSATYNKADKAVYVNVLNRSEKQDISAKIENQQGRLGASAAEWRMNHTNLKETHTFGDDKKVRPATKNVTLQVANNAFTYAFPAHSLTILKIGVE